MPQAKILAANGYERAGCDTLQERLCLILNLGCILIMDEFWKTRNYDL